MPQTDIQLIHGDCLEKMRDIPDNSVDCVITDPPYKLTSGGCKGKLNIVFNKTDYKGTSSGKMFEIPNFSCWMENCYRILKDGTHFYCMTNDKNMYDILKSANNVGFKEVNILVWKKYMHTPLPYYMKNIEFIVLFRKGKARKINNTGSYTLIENIKGIYGNKVHPSEKPNKLMEYLIENSTDKKDLILDPFMGSGTAGVSCINTNRRFIGIEKDDDYFEIAQKRIGGALKQKQQNLF